MDIRSFLESFVERDVRFLVIGALAMPHHGYARATLDVDVFIEPTPENSARTREALSATGFDVTDLPTDDLLKYKVLIRDDVLQVDIHPFVAGADFANVFARSELTDMAGVSVRVPCLDDLIAMKRAAGRPKDLDDLTYLMALRDRKARRE